MATKIRKRTDTKKVVRFKRKARIRSVLEGNSSKPRMSIFRSNTHIYAQIVDDSMGVTIVAASTQEKEFRSKSSSNIEGAKLVGRLVAERALEKKISGVVFDRGGYLYHGKIKALADAARAAGLKF